MIQNNSSGAAINRSSLQATTGRIAAVATALFLVLFLVLSVSRAAFSAETLNENNLVSTGGVVLRDNDGGSALFNIDGGQDLGGLDLPDLPLDILPLSDKVSCITVQYDGDFSSGPVKLYQTQVGDTLPADRLDTFLNVKAEMVEIPDVATLGDVNAADCTLFTTATVAAAASAELDDAAVLFDKKLSAIGTDHDSGETTFPGEDSTYIFKFTISVADDAAAGGKTANWNFTWRTES